MFVAHAAIPPSTKTGSIITMSGRCVPPPVYASLPMKTSPSRISSSGWRAVTCSTTPISEPRCIGMCIAWQSVRPRASKRHVELSRRSFTFVEYAARTSVSPISSTIDDSALPMTSTKIGSRRGASPPFRRSTRAFGALLPASPQQPDAPAEPALGGLGSAVIFDNQVGELIDVRMLPMQQQRRRIHLLHDRGALDLVAGAETLAVVDRATDQSARFGEPHVAIADPRSRNVRRGGGMRRHVRVADGGDRLQTERHDLDRLFLRDVAVHLLVRALEARPERLEQRRAGRLVREHDRQLVVLAGVAHVHRAPPRARRGRSAFALEPRGRARLE